MSSSKKVRNIKLKKKGGADDGRYLGSHGASSKRDCDSSYAVVHKNSDDSGHLWQLKPQPGNGNYVKLMKMGGSDHGRYLGAHGRHSKRDSDSSYAVVHKNDDDSGHLWQLKPQPGNGNDVKLMKMGGSDHGRHLAAHGPHSRRDSDSSYAIVHKGSVDELWMMIDQCDPHEAQMQRDAAAAAAADEKCAQMQRDYEAKHAALVQQFEAARNKWQQEMDNAEQKFKQDAANPQQYDKKQEDIYESFLETVKTLEDADKKERPSVAVLGQNGVGKSSLINALAGQKVTEVGDTDCTQEMSKVYSSDTTDFYDVPGCDEVRSYCNLQQILKVKEMHLILVCYVDRVGHIAKLEKLVASCKVPWVVVRTKIDQVGKEADQTKMLSTEQKKIKGKLCYVSALKSDGLDNLKAMAAEASKVLL